MRDGVIMLDGTPADIVLNPADSYVANFTNGMSKLRYVTVRFIMRDFTVIVPADAP